MAKEYVEKAFKEFKKDLIDNGIQLDSLEFEVEDCWVSCILKNVEILDPDFEISDTIETIIALCKKHTYDESISYKDYDGSQYTYYKNSIFFNLYDRDGSPIDPFGLIADSL